MIRTAFGEGLNVIGMMAGRKRCPAICTLALLKGKDGPKIGCGMPALCACLTRAVIPAVDWSAILGRCTDG